MEELKDLESILKNVTPEMYDIDAIKPYEKNAKMHDEIQINNVAESIKQFGFVQPIVIDKNNEIIIGHCRYEASKKLNLDKVPCVKVTLSKDKVKKLRILDNKLNESAWDFSLLADDIIDLDFDGFNIDFGLPEKEEETEIIEDEVPEIDEENEPITKLGDIWQLGEHRLMCGDSTKEENVAKLMNGSKADLLFTDPPYNVNIAEKKKKILHCNEYNEIANDNMNEEDFKVFLGKVFTNANNFIKNDASYYVFSCQGGDNEMMMMMRESGIKCRHQIIWVKDAPVFSMGRLDYDYKHEPILYGWKEKHNFYRKGEQDKSVWEYKRTENKLHPTMKPVELIANALNNSTKKNDLVLDLFGGSGSTMIACEQLNRKCYMMEYDPHYIAVIIARWEKLTNKKAVLLNV